LRSSFDEAQDDTLASGKSLLRIKNIDKAMKGMNNKPEKSKVSPTGGDLEGAKENSELEKRLK